MEKKDKNKKATAKKDVKTKAKAAEKKVTKKAVKNEKVKAEKTEEEIIIREITEKDTKKKFKLNFKKISFKKINKKDALLVLAGLVVGVIISVLFINRVPKLANGEEVVVSLKKNSYSAQDIYAELKPTNGLNTVLRLIDLDLVKNYYNGSLDEDAEKSAKEQAETYISQYTSYGYDEASFLAYYGFSDKQAFIDYLVEDYKLNQYYTEYVKSTIKDEDVQSYYDTYGIGKKTVYIFSEKDGTENLDAIRKALKNGTSVDKLVEKYDKVTAVTVNDKFEIDYSSITSYSDAVISYIKKTNAGKYSKVFKDDTFGNVVIYVSAAEETPKLEDIKSNIVDALVSQAQSKDGNLYYKAFIKLRKDNGIKFYDKDLKKQYSDYVAKYTGETTTTTAAAK